jgi:FtsP/CotA-like multicopper oxidase with cupredoxin domain
MTSRRELLKGSAATVVLALSPLKLTSRETSKSYSLIAKRSAHTFDETVKTNLWLYNRMCPGPLIEANQNDLLTVKFKNELDQPTTIHWHGIRNLNRMDGVPDLTQPAVEPGETFVYTFPVKDAGTFWYHAHNKSWEQVARGLYGPLIVRLAGGMPANRDILIVADDWALKNDLQLQEKTLGDLGDWSHGGRLGNSLTINGKFLPTIKVPSSGPIRLRILNAANARPFIFQISGTSEVKIIATDGSPCPQFVPEKIALGPAQRVDVLINDCSTIGDLLETSTGQDYVTAKFRRESDRNDIGNWDLSGKPFYEFPKLKEAKVVAIHMQGGAMGNLGSAEFEGAVRPLRDLAMKESKLWAFNGKIGGYSLNLADCSIGDTVILRVWNDTAWPHSMHLHGHHFWVKSTEFSSTERTILRDTYLMQPGERADLVFNADNPGLWLFHCHMLEHHAAGMGGVISVQT